MRCNTVLLGGVLALLGVGTAAPAPNANDPVEGADLVDAVGTDLEHMGGPVPDYSWHCGRTMNRFNGAYKYDPNDNELTEPRVEISKGGIAKPACMRLNKQFKFYESFSNCRACIFYPRDDCSDDGYIFATPELRTRYNFTEYGGLQSYKCFKNAQRRTKQWVIPPKLDEGAEDVSPINELPTDNASEEPVSDNLTTRGTEEAVEVSEEIVKETTLSDLEVPNNPEVLNELTPSSNRCGKVYYWTFNDPNRNPNNYE
ncbi:hypothetical protein M011DRAFT_483759 [Sporormia fimetaria CBS 119925]|uniref:Uncharacterized protein n=1 Tax=Sporormia fimetaria CBS 119925 TaxID=1340428 RepID=A0A6A6VJP5_9PLEO|nr:hypothetical protein M011DRAFT_483759 [Sporormia fimetaria CBS 119925]